jgi:hypothetical protein
MIDEPRPQGARSRPDAREIARRNRDVCGGALSPVLRTAATACEVAETPPAQRSVAPRGETD